MRFSDFITRFKMSATAATPALDQPSTVWTPDTSVELEQLKADSLSIGDYCYRTPDSRTLSLVVGGSPQNWQLLPINSELTIYRDGSPLLANVRASTAEYIPKFGETRVDFQQLFKTLTITLPDLDLTIADTLYPFATDEECYKIKMIEYLALNLTRIEAVLL